MTFVLHSNTIYLVIKMKDKIVCVRVNSNVYNESKKILDSFGINMSVGVNMFLKKVCLEKKLPFELAYDDYNDKTKEAINNCFQVYEEDSEYNSVEEMIEDSKNWKED